MKKDDYLIQYRDIENDTIKSLLTLLEKTDGKPLKELKVVDLTYHDKQAIWPGQGVYLFRNDKRVIYVGKVSSMSFTERIPKHFDLRSYAWMNSLLKIISKKELNHETQNEYNLKKASEYAFENLNVVLINFEKRDRINRAERLLRACTKPLNCFKHLVEKDLDKIIQHY